MTKKEVKDMLIYIDGLYPSFINGRDINIVFNSWYEFFKNQDNDKVRSNLDRWVMNNSFPPAPCNIAAADWSKYE